MRRLPPSRLKPSRPTLHKPQKLQLPSSAVRPAKPQPLPPMVLLSLLASAEADDEHGFHELIGDLLPWTERQRLWQAAVRLMADRIGAR